MRRRYWVMKQTTHPERGSKNKRGLPVCSVDEYVSWAKDHPEFKRLWAAYMASDRLFRLKPTVDRIDPKKGYVLGNMQWLTFSANSQKGRFETTFRNKTGFRGVARNGKKYRVLCMINGTRTHVGCFETAEAAGRAYDRWAKVNVGSGATLNFPEG